MISKISVQRFAIGMTIAVTLASASWAQAVDNPTVILEVSNQDGIAGDVVIELFGQEAPVSTGNFLEYVDSEFYDGLIFHRVVAGFVVQGGGFDADLTKLPTNDSIINESFNGLRNQRGTVAMARTGDPNSATSQFYINLVDNAALDYQNAGNVGYCVFGRVLRGMDVVDAIAATPVHTENSMENVPVDDVFSTTVRRLGELFLADPNVASIQAVTDHQFSMSVEAFNIADDDPADPNRTLGVNIYLSAEPNQLPSDPNSEFVGQFSQSLTSAGANYNGAAIFTGPAAGTYYLTAAVTDANSPEPGVLNSWTGSITLEVEPNAPDLVMADPEELQLRVELNDQIELPWAIANIGGIAAAPAEAGGTIGVTLYRSTEPNFVPGNPGNLAIGGYTVESVPASSQMNEALTFTSPGELGNYYLTAIADGADSVAEYDETNNIGTTITMIVEPNLPDLVGLLPDVAEPNDAVIEAWTGQAVNINIKMFNDGHAGAYPDANDLDDAIKVSLYMSADADFTDSQAVGNFTMLGLGEGSAITQTITFTTPADPGTYYLRGRVDDDNDIVEFNESNNYTDVMTLIVDLEPQPMTITRFVATAGATTNSDSFYATGTFEPNSTLMDSDEPVVIDLGVYQESLERAGWVQLGSLNRYFYSTGTGGITLGLLDLDGGTFLLSARNIDLTGLSAPADLEIRFARYLASAQTPDSAVIPMQFMAGYADSLRVTFGYITTHRLTDDESLSLRGLISAQDTSVELADYAVTIAWGYSFSETIGAGSFSRIGTMQVYSNAAAVGGISLAVFDFDRCTFLVNVNHAELNPSLGTVTFSVQFGDFDQTVP